MLPLHHASPDTLDYLIFQVKEEERFHQEIEETTNVEVLFVTDQRLEKIRLEVNKDTSLQTLMTVIMTGWPDDKVKVLLCIREYWPYWDELTTQNGLAFRGTRIIIPSSMRAEMTDRAHASHLGIQYTTNTARQIMYWPRMTADLTEAVQRCNTCQESKPALHKEPMMTYPIPKQPWQVVASDCFEREGQHYLVLVDLYSDYIDVSQLPSLTTATLIKQLKQAFATHGVPAVLITDNGTNYDSHEFSKFVTAWEFSHVTSSPHHHKSNGKAESAVKIMKDIVKKAQKEGSDIWKAMTAMQNHCPTW